MRPPPVTIDIQTFARTFDESPLRYQQRRIVQA